MKRSADAKLAAFTIEEVVRLCRALEGIVQRVGPAPTLSAIASAYDWTTFARADEMTRDLGAYVLPAHMVLDGAADDDASPVYVQHPDVASEGREDAHALRCLVILELRCFDLLPNPDNPEQSEELRCMPGEQCRARIRIALSMLDGMRELHGVEAR